MENIRGFSRLDAVLARFPVSSSSWWQGVKEGRYPPGVKLGSRITAWSNADLDVLETLLVEGKNWKDS